MIKNIFKFILIFLSNIFLILLIGVGRLIVGLLNLFLKIICGIGMFVSKVCFKIFGLLIPIFIILEIAQVCTDPNLWWIPLVLAGIIYGAIFLFVLASIFIPTYLSEFLEIPRMYLYDGLIFACGNISYWFSELVDGFKNNFSKKENQSSVYLNNKNESDKESDLNNINSFTELIGAEAYGRYDSKTGKTSITCY